MDATLEPGAEAPSDVPAPTVPMAPATRLHPDLAALSFLLGTWLGEGEGEWPGSEPFRYVEEVVFEHVGDDFLLYRQRSWSPNDGAPIHFERGFLRPAGPQGVELVLAHPIGVTEVAAGSVAGTVLELASTSIGLTATGSRVSELRRRIEVRGDELGYELWMTTPDVPSRSHVRSRLRRA